MKAPGEPNASLFDGADVTGIGWGAGPKDAPATDLAALRLFADRCEAEIDAALCRSAADEIDALRAEMLALKKGLATQARQLAAFRRGSVKEASSPIYSPSAAEGAGDE